jgi:hypothetical protein
MTTSARVKISSLVNIMSTHQQKEWNMVQGSVCNCFHPTWKLAFDVMVAKLSQTTLCIHCHGCNVKGGHL